jgi:hypothetical protein
MNIQNVTVGTKMETTFDPENITGLSEEEAAGLLKKEGYNELPSQKNRACCPSY